LASFATLSNGEKIPNPRFFRDEEKELARVQRKLSKAAKGTPERRAALKVVERVHERISNKSRTYALGRTFIYCIVYIKFNK
jgi:putative transposase